MCKKHQQQVEAGLFSHTINVSVESHQSNKLLDRDDFPAIIKSNGNVPLLPLLAIFKKPALAAFKKVFDHSC